MRRLVVVLAAVMSLGALTGCNTIRGLGQDLQKAGERIEDAASTTPKR